MPKKLSIETRVWEGLTAFFYKKVKRSELLDSDLRLTTRFPRLDAPLPAAKCPLFHVKAKLPLGHGDQGFQGLFSHGISSRQLFQHFDYNGTLLHLQPHHRDLKILTVLLEQAASPMLPVQ